jgi:hypothetical protein
MTFVSKLAIATLLIGTACAPAVAAPLAPSSIAPDASIQQVQDRHWHGGYRGGGWRHRHYGGSAAVIGGLAAGALIGGAIASSQAQANASAYCAQRFRSYDPASGTYLSSDGLRRPCP